MRIRGKHPGIPDPNFSIPDPGSKRFRIADYRITVFLTHKLLLRSLKYDPGCSIRIPDPDLDSFPISDPGVIKAPIPDPGVGSVSTTLVEMD